MQAALCKDFVLNGSLDGSPTTLDPSQITENSQWHMLSQLGVNLVSTDSGVLKPEAAASWTIDKVTKRFEFRLRPSLKLSNGQVVTADDWVSTFRRLLASNGPTKVLLEPYLSADGITSPEPQTLVLQLKKPYLSFLSRLSSPEFVLVPRSTVRPDGAIDWTVSSGPFRLDTAQPNTDGSRVLLANPLSFRYQQLQPTRVVIHSRPNSKAELFLQLAQGHWQFSFGEVLATEQDGNQFQALLDSAKIESVATEFNSGVFFAGRPTRSLKSARVRSAIFGHLLRQVRALGAKLQSIPAGQLFPPGFDGHLAPAILSNEWASALNETLPKSDLPKSLIAIHPPSAKLFGYAEWFRAEMAKIGVKVTLIEMTYDEYGRSKNAIKHDFFLFKTGMNLSDPIGSMLGLFGKNGLFYDPNGTLVAKLHRLSNQANSGDAQNRLADFSKLFLRSAWTFPAFHSRTAFHYAHDIVIGRMGPVDQEVHLETFRQAGGAE